MSLKLQRDSSDDPMKAAGMVTDRRIDMSSMGDFNGVVGKNLGSRHQFHKDSAMDRSSYFDKVNRPGQFHCLFRAEVLSLANV